MREQLVRILRGQNIEVPPASIPESRSLYTALTFIDIDVEELKAHHMRGYGEVPEGAAKEQRTGAIERKRSSLRYVMIGIGGAVGAIARFWVGGFIGQRLGTRLPYGTFVINCSGSLLVGFIVAILTERTHLNPNWRYLIPIGFIGAYTTFSTFEYETMRSIQDGQVTVATLYVVASVVIGFMCVWIGAAAGRALP